MPELRRPGAAVLLGLGVATLAPTSTTAEPEPSESFALQLSIEMAAHRRLVEIMDEAGYTPAPFVTDGCSGGLSMAWDVIADLLPAFAETHEEHPPWEACCVTHDRAYHAAGGARTAEESYRARLAADQALRACVLDTGARRTEHLSETYNLSEVESPVPTGSSPMPCSMRCGSAADPAPVCHGAGVTAIRVACSGSDPSPERSGSDQANSLNGMEYGSTFALISGM